MQLSDVLDIEHICYYYPGADSSSQSSTEPADELDWDTSSVTFDLEVKAVDEQGLDLTTPSSPTDDDLALMKSQGAIPKKIRARSSVPGQTTSSTHQEGSRVKGETFFP